MINIFAKPAFVNTSPGQDYQPGRKVNHGHMQRVSSMIRGEQIAERLGAALNPETVLSDDTCIYVKPHVKAGQEVTFQGRAWLDIVDGWALLPVLEANPQVGVIACSDMDGVTLAKRLPHHCVVVIPQHHCNFERRVRAREGVTVAGVIGTEDSFAYLPPGLEAALAERGIKLWRFSKFYTRADIVDFYMNIDVQIVWRPWRKRLANPLKIVNAAAFGVPTVALDESYFGEVAGMYLQCFTVAGLLEHIDFIKGAPLMMANYSRECLEVAEAYHIDRIAEKYKEL